MDTKNNIDISKPSKKIPVKTNAQKKQSGQGGRPSKGIRKHVLAPVIIKYPRFKDLHDDIRLCQQMTQIAGEANCMALEGDAGAGKSTLVQDFASSFPRAETEDGTEIPVLYVETPAPVTVKRMASYLLEVMGDPAYDSGTLTSMDVRLVGLIADCKVQLIILDDFHHLIDQETKRVLAKVSDWLKVLIKETKVTFLVVGKKGSIETILLTNSQLSRLFAIRRTLDPFNWDPDSPEDQEEFDTFIRYLEKARLPIDEKLPRNEVLCRIYYATRGVVANIINLFNLSTAFAEKAGDQEIRTDHLLAACEERLMMHAKLRINPFTCSWGTCFVFPETPYFPEDPDE
jgi:hypothetical protein